MLLRANPQDALTLWRALPDPIRARIPREDAWTLSGEARVARLRAEIHRRQRLARMLADGFDIDKGVKVWMGKELIRKRQKFKEHCARDPVFFLNNCIWTRDPEGRMGLGRVLPLVLLQYQVEKWIMPWTGDLDEDHIRRAHKKDRRLRMTITRAAWEVWAFRFVPGSSAWWSTDKDDTLDNGEDWNSLFGKFRFMWHQCRTYYPWLFPHLPPHSDVNQRKYIRYPEKDPETGRRLDEDDTVIGNELYGFLPNEVAARGGAASRGFMDEAAWIESLEKAVDSFDDMTPVIHYASSPGLHRQVYFGRLCFEMQGVIVNDVQWLDDGSKLDEICWTEPDTEGFPWPGQWRGHSEQWRSRSYANAAKGKTSDIMARNWDGDWDATAAAKVFRNVDPSIMFGSTSPDDPTYDLFDPELELQVWYDVGRADPWAFLWVQVDMRNGWVNIVDYYVKNGVTAHWWVPALKGWPLDRSDLWLSAPEALPWDQVVKQPYTKEEKELIGRWHGRRAYRGGRVKLMCGDFIGASHGYTDLMSVEERYMAYGLMCQSASVSHQMDRLIEHADEVLLRTRISGRLIGLRPGGIWPSVDECFTSWRRQESKLTTPVTAKPIHDQYSHTCTAFVFGARWLPQQLRARIVGEDQRRVVEEDQMDPSRVAYSREGWY